MKALLVRVQKGEVKVAGDCVASLGQGLVVFAGIEKNDNQKTLEAMAVKIVNLRIFESEDGKMNYSLKEKNYSLLCISNFTLCANTRKGRRPSFEEAMPKKDCEKLFKNFVSLLQNQVLEVKTGIFGASMHISLEYDGPVNIFLETTPGMHTLGE
ncbi:MAG: D-aminoacyl-tRNA deacylase [Candidatus Omnitrophota bacterium]